MLLNFFRSIVDALNERVYSGLIDVSVRAERSLFTFFSIIYMTKLFMYQRCTGFLAFQDWRVICE